MSLIKKLNRIQPICKNLGPESRQIKCQPHRVHFLCIALCSYHHGRSKTIEFPLPCINSRCLNALTYAQKISFSCFCLRFVTFNQITEFITLFGAKEKLIHILYKVYFFQMLFKRHVVHISISFTLVLSSRFTEPFVFTGSYLDW